MATRRRPTPTYSTVQPLLVINWFLKRALAQLSRVSAIIREFRSSPARRTLWRRSERVGWRLILRVIGTQLKGLGRRHLVAERRGSWRVRSISTTWAQVNSGVFAWLILLNSPCKTQGGSASVGPVSINAARRLHSRRPKIIVPAGDRTAGGLGRCRRTGSGAGSFPARSGPCRRRLPDVRPELMRN